MLFIRKYWDEGKEGKVESCYENILTVVQLEENISRDSGFRATVLFDTSVHKKYTVRESRVGLLLPLQIILIIYLFIVTG